jgi:hypothetical protein
MVGRFAHKRPEGCAFEDAGGKGAVLLLPRDCRFGPLGFHQTCQTCEQRVITPNAGCSTEKNPSYSLGLAGLSVLATRRAFGG